MNKLHYFNLVGVAALAILCLSQWGHDRRLNLKIIELEKSTLAQDARIAEREQSLHSLAADLDQFKSQLIKSQSDADESRQKFLSAERILPQITTERDQLKSSVINWANAVALRDERLKRDNEEIGRLTDRLNASIIKYNQLATNYNGVVKELNELYAGATKKAAP